MRTRLSKNVIFEKSAAAENFVKIQKIQESLPVDPGAIGQTDHYVLPPVDFSAVLELHYTNPFHARCTQIKAEFIAGGGAESSSLDWLEESTPEDSVRELLYKTAYDLDLFGNAYWEISRLGKDKIEIYHVPAWTVFAKGTYKFEQWASASIIPFENFSKTPEAESSLLQFRHYSPLSSYYGLPRWLAAIESLRIDKNLKLFLISFFQNRSLPDFILFLQGADFGQKAEEKIEAALVENKGPENAHKVMTLSSPFEDSQFKIERLTVPIKELELEHTYRQIRDEIVTAHGVPPRLVGITTAGQLGGTGEQDMQMELFLKSVVESSQVYLNEQINKFLFAPMGKKEDFQLVAPKREEKAEPNPDPAEKLEGQVEKLKKQMETFLI